MKRIAFAAAAALSGLAAAPASAVIIDFGGLNNVNVPVLSYTEDGFTFTSAGFFFADTAYGNPVPSVQTGRDNASFTITNGSTFRFLALDGSAAGIETTDTSDYSIQGFLGATRLFVQTGRLVGGPADNVFVTIQSTNTSALIDRLLVTQTASTATTSRGSFYDNINVVAAAVTPPTTPAVPEPATWAMMLAGFGLVGAGMRTRRRFVTCSAG